MIFVDTSTSYASPKLFSMNAIRFPSGDHDARSPKYDRRVMLGGRLSSGLPGFVPCGDRIAMASASVEPRSVRIRGFHWICDRLSSVSRAGGQELRSLVNRKNDPEVRSHRTVNLT